LRTPLAGLKLLLAPHGTRGDVQPLLALAMALRARGHHPSFLVPDDLVAWIRGRDFPCRANGIDVTRTLQQHAAHVRLAGWQFRYLRDVLAPALFESFDRIEPGFDAIIGAGVQPAAVSVAEKWGAAYAHAVFCPCAVPNDAAPPAVIKTQSLPRFLNRFIWNWGVPVAGLALRGAINRGRSRLGLRPLLNPLSHLLSQPTLLAADPDLAPGSDDLALNVTAVDAWVLEDRAQELDPRVARFLDLNPQPVYVGFGSMVAANARVLADRAVAAVQSVGRAALIVGGGPAFRDELANSEDVLVIDEVPHDIVLPRVAAAVHHGGAGTTAAVARAGVPQVIVPHLLDQYYWASRVEHLGLGPRPLPVDLVTADVLAERLDRALNDPGFRGRTKAFAPVISARNGVDAAVDFLEQLVSGSPMSG
jgi:vancomycin aglycone glucosyltransferase